MNITKKSMSTRTQPGRAATIQSLIIITYGT